MDRAVVEVMKNTPLILYVEDNHDNRKLVERVLRAAGFLFHGVDDSTAALAFVSTQIPDLILMDINLPRTDGYSLTRQLREREALTNTPIIALTANVLVGDRQKTAAAGCDGYIQKPINVDRLPDQIMRFLVTPGAISEF